MIGLKKNLHENKKNIIYLGINHSNFGTGSYYHDLASAFDKKHKVFFYGPGHENYDTKDTINRVFEKSKSKFDNIDLIICSNSWGNENPYQKSFDPHPNINLSKLKNIKKIFFLNKEYKKLKEKLKYISKQKFDLVTTVLLNEEFDKWALETNTKFITIPFAVDLENFKLINSTKKYDFIFTGSLHKDYSNLRSDIKKLIFKKNHVKKLTNKFLISNPIKQYYQKYSIFWSEWGAKSIFGKHITPIGKNYVKILNQSKISLNTLSAFDIFNPRFYELMATKTLIFCPRSCLKYNILKENYNCIVFEDSLNDFTQKLNSLLSGQVNYRKITENAFIDVVSNTYEDRVNTIINTLWTS